MLDLHFAFTCAPPMYEQRTLLKCESLGKHASLRFVSCRPFAPHDKYAKSLPVTVHQHPSVLVTVSPYVPALQSSCAKQVYLSLPFLLSFPLSFPISFFPPGHVISLSDLFSRLTLSLVNGL